jgi:hypothetical protein
VKRLSIWVIFPAISSGVVVQDITVTLTPADYWIVNERAALWLPLFVEEFHIMFRGANSKGMLRNAPQWAYD